MQASPTRGVEPPRLRSRFWARITRPAHAAAVHDFRTAAEHADVVRLAALFHPAMAVVLDSGAEQSGITAVRGTRDAIRLVRNLFAEPSLVIAERSINAQAGLTLSRGDEVVAFIAVDFIGERISMLWVRLRPTVLRHWNAI